MNKNLLLVIMLLPFLTGAAYFLYKEEISSYLIQSLNNETPLKAENKDPLKLDEIQTRLQLKNINSNISTEDNKGLGYTGQNKLALDSKGNLYYVYRDKEESKYEIFITKIDKNANVIFNKAITTIKSTQRVPSITIDYKDNVHVVWYGLDSEESELGRQIKYIKSINGGETWTSPINIGPVLGYKLEDYWQEHPQISSFDKNLYIVWEGKDAANANQQIKFIVSKNLGETWSNWKNVYLTKTSSQSRPSIIIDSQGNLHLFFYSTFGESSQAIRYSFSSDKGNTWKEPINLSNSESDSRHVAASYLKNKIIATWREGPTDIDDGVSQIFYSILDLKENKWTKPQLVSPSSSYQFFPSITTNGTTAIISWMENKSFSEFPNEDPKPSDIYLTNIDLNKNEISEQIYIDNSSAYPNLYLNIEQNIFYLLYQKNLNPSAIILKTGVFE